MVTKLDSHKINTPPKYALLSTKYNVDLLNDQCNIKGCHAIIAKVALERVDWLMVATHCEFRYKAPPFRDAKLSSYSLLIE